MENSFRSLCLLVLAWAGPGFAQATARLNVRFDRPGVVVYLDDDSIGVTPVESYPVEPGDHWVSIFNPDSVQNMYYVLQSGAAGRKLRQVWHLAKVAKGTVRFEAKPDEMTDITFSRKAIDRAPCEAKWLACACVGTPFALGLLLGVLIMALTANK